MSTTQTDTTTPLIAAEERSTNDSEVRIETLVTMDDLSSSLEDLTTAFEGFNDLSAHFTNIPSEYGLTLQDVEACIVEIRNHEQNQREEFEAIKSKMDVDIKQEVELGISGQIADLIREEAMMQIREQVDEQIREHIPVSLEDQVKETKRQLQEVQISLKNSEARMVNSFIQSMNLFDNLSPVLTSAGEKSPLYPVNVKSLFGYDLESAKKLSRDYELREADDLHTNFRQFLKHIGTNVDVFIPDDSED
ncbi:hypothetical protein NLJ89_g2158 [Agrocybe chaxingu]|uniref:Uncharacterized protein n=1 Tax=Agrocybe chaxingu TaxID=84603 RepID=A0A9W8K7Z8_9AGAR|nr:hypothetical protein NLJ89_g2158 [Agrocybe chaxingu]